MPEVEQSKPSATVEHAGGWTASGEYVESDASCEYEKPRWEGVVGLDGSIPRYNLRSTTSKSTNF